MSTSFTIFVKSRAARASLAEFVGGELGVAFAQDSEPNVERFVVPFMGLWVAVYEACDFDDDLGIQFSRFTTAISITRYAGEPNAAVVVNFARSLACVLGSRLHTKFGIDNLVVEEMQKVIATFADVSGFGRADA